MCVDIFFLYNIKFFLPQTGFTDYGKFILYATTKKALIYFNLSCKNKYLL